MLPNGSSVYLNRQKMSVQLPMPRVSILIAARNEEANITDLLQSLTQLNYPQNKLEILVGDDNSTDQTANVVRDFTQELPHIKLFLIEPATTQLRGKANVLAQLAQYATGDFLLFTDADMITPSTWVEEMLEHFEDNVGVVVGSTATIPSSLFARCQGIEWLTVLFFMEFCGKFNIPTTGMGNNMAVSQVAYNAVGGYENIPFSIVEDYALYQAIIKEGFGFKHVFNEEILTHTKPPENYFSQRKRWISGGVKSKSPLIFLAFVQALAFPVFLCLLLFDVHAAFWLFACTFFLNTLLGGVALYKIKFYTWLFYLPAYSVYISVFWFLQLLNFALPGAISWKNRSY